MSPTTWLRDAALRAEDLWDRRPSVSAPLRLEVYDGHGEPGRAILRARLLAGAAPTPAVAGEPTLAAVRRVLASFSTRERAGVAVRVRVGGTESTATTDAEGYLVTRLDLGPATGGPWVEGTLELDDDHGVLAEPFSVRVTTPQTGFGVISDVDDTLLVTGVRRPLLMLRHTVTGSALTRRTFDGAPDLYRALAAGSAGPETHPVFYVSSSPWNLHHFLVAFLERHGFPRGPLLLRDLLGTRHGGRAARSKLTRLVEVFDLHPDTSFVLLGDSGEEDAQLYAELTRRYPGRVLAVLIREVRARAGGEPVDDVVAGWTAPPPILLTRDTADMAGLLVDLGLLDADT